MTTRATFSEVVEALITGISLLTIFAAQAVHADTLNSEFGEDGWIRQSIYNGPVGSQGSAVTLQADGKIVAAGRSGEISDDIIIARYDVDGSLDTTFGDGGTTVVNVPGSGDAEAVGIQADQKIVIAGGTALSDRDIMVARLNPDGTPDSTFGADGVVTDDLSNDEFIEDLVLQPDGKIIVAGRSLSTQMFESDALVVRYNSDGSRDNTFGTDGVVLSTGEANAVALQADNKIVIGGADFESELIRISRFNSNGSLDTTFDADGDNDGIVEVSFGAGTFPFLQDLVILPDQRIVALAYAGDGSGTNMLLLRFDTDGTIDTTFDEGVDINGRVDFDIPDSDVSANAIAARDDGKVVIGGESDFQGDMSNPPAEQVFVARFNTDGTLDSAFDSDGVATFDIATDERDRLTDVIVDSSGRVVGVGSAGNTEYFYDLAVMRFTASGAPDSAFSADGVAITTLDGPYESRFYRVAVQNDCKILAGGFTASEDPSRISLVRYNPDGSLDSTFGDTGIVLHSIGTRSSSAKGLALRPDGRILVADASRTDQDTSQAAIVQFLPDGSIDTGFGAGGTSLTDIEADGTDTWYDLLVLPDGRILATGVADLLSAKDLVVARFESDGTIDTAFGTGGVYRTSSLAYGRGLALTSDGKYLVAGADNSSDALVNVLRLNTDGTLDTSFGGGDGRASSSLEGSGGFRSNPMTVQDDGKILITGTIFGGSTLDLGVVRFTPEGLPDATFDGDGLAINDFGSYQEGREVRVQGDGKIIVAGYHNDTSVNTMFGIEQFMTVRYNPDGSLDSGYGNGGLAGFEYQLTESNPYGMAFGNRHVYLAGFSDGDFSALLDLEVEDVQSGCQSAVVGKIAALGDINSNGSPEIAVARPGSTRVQIRDGATDALITDMDFGEDTAFEMAVLPDLDGSGDPEIAILQQQSSGHVRVQARDAVTGAVTSNLWYGLQYQPVSMDTVPDSNGNGFPEVAVLGSQDGTDAVRVQLRDSKSGNFVANVFLGTQSIANDVVSLTDTSGNGLPEIGILGVLKGNDQVRTQIWDADTAAFQANVWFGKVYQPRSMITMPDINSNGSDEIVAVGVDPATQNIRVQVRDSNTTAILYNIWLGSVNEAVDIELINDINSDGIPDLAVLLKTPDGTGRVRVQSGLDGAFIRNLFYSVVENPVGLAVMPDYSGNGFDELAVSGKNAGVRHVQILDTSTGSQVNRIDFH